MGLLDRKKLLESKPLEVVKVDLGDDFVYVREMMAWERDKYEQSLRKELKDEKGNPTFELSLENHKTKLAVCTMCDEKGELLFKPEEWILVSKNMSSSKMEKIVKEAQKLNAISEEEKESIVKNSEAGQPGNSISDSVES